MKEEEAMLSERQLIHFQTFGFLIFRGLFNPDEIKTLNTEFDHGLESAYRHAPEEAIRKQLKGIAHTPAKFNRPNDPYYPPH